MSELVQQEPTRDRVLSDLRRHRQFAIEQHALIQALVQHLQRYTCQKQEIPCPLLSPQHSFAHVRATTPTSPTATTSTDHLLRRIAELKREKQEVMEQMEKEEESLAMALQQRLQQVQSERVRMEITMENEQENMYVIIMHEGF
jgi:hypothetical protein